MCSGHSVPSLSKRMAGQRKEEIDSNGSCVRIRPTSCRRPLCLARVAAVLYPRFKAWRTSELLPTLSSSASMPLEGCEACIGAQVGQAGHTIYDVGSRSTRAKGEGESWAGNFAFVLAILEYWRVESISDKFIVAIPNWFCSIASSHACRVSPLSLALQHMPCLALALRTSVIIPNSLSNH